MENLKGKRTKKICDGCGIPRNNVIRHRGMFLCGKCIRNGKYLSRK